MAKKWMPRRYVPTHMAMGQTMAMGQVQEVQASPFVKLLHVFVLGYGLYCLASRIGRFFMRYTRSIPSGV